MKYNLKTDSMDKIGFIGLGIMGKPMAKNLVKSGYDLIVYDIRKDVVADLVVSGAEEGFSPCEIATKSNIIITMLPNSPEVREVILGKDGIIEGVKPGSVVIDMSSISPVATKEICAVLSTKGVTLLDAPVSGGEPKAVEGTLAIMVGGDESTFKKVREILLRMGSSAVYIGETGSGNVAKLANQIIVAMNIAAMSEAMVFAAKAGVNPEKVFNAISGGLAGSTVLNAKMPMVLKGNFKPGFRIELHIKDLMNAAETGQVAGAPLIFTDQVLEIMKSLKVDGKGMDDHCSIIQYYEKMAGVTVRNNL